MTKLFMVTSDYFDGDHDHGYYEVGPFSTLELAKNAAEKLAQYRWPEGHWEWRQTDLWHNFILHKYMIDIDYIHIDEVVVDQEFSDNPSIYLHITYT